MELHALAGYFRKFADPARFPQSLLLGLKSGFYRLALRVAPRWTVRRTLGKLAGQLSQAAGLLPEISRKIGEKFLRSEQLLETLTEASERLLVDSQELLGLASGQNQGLAIVDETRTLLEAPLAYLDLWQRELVGQLTDLATVRNLVHGVMTLEEDLERCVLPLRFIQSMFRMESASLPEGVRQVFSSLTGRIDEIERQVRETLSHQFQAISGTRETIEHVVTKVQVLAHEVEQTVLSRRLEVADLLTCLTAEIQKNHGREIQLITNSREVSTQTGRLVVALQAHDIVSQKMEHVRSSLDAGIEAIGKMQGPLAVGELKLSVSRTRGLLEIQSAQAASIGQDLRHADQSIREAMGGIHCQASLLDNDCLLLKEYSQVTGAASGTVEVLFEIIGDIRELIQKTVSAAYEAHQLIAPIAGVVTGLTSDLDRLSHEMRLISLNSQIQAVQIGLGTGLEVLSAHTADVSLETTRLTSEVSAQLERFTSDIESILSGFQELSQAGDAAVEDFRGKSSLQESRLHGLRDLMLAKLRSVGDTAEHIGRSTTALTSQPGVGNEIEGVLATIGDTLDRACLEFRKLSPVLDHPNLTVELHHSQYTMAAERRTHQAVVERLSGAPVLDLHVQPEASAIELF